VQFISSEENIGLWENDAEDLYEEMMD